MPKKKILPTASDFRGNAGAEKLLSRAENFRNALRAWFLRERRDLPWRRERTVYRTVVSEFMLQQTQVDVVLSYFENWTRKWNDFAALAGAEEEEVLRAWEGLGYYSRAKNLLSLAQKIAEENHVPASVEEWLKFRGIGAYTAAAISSIAQGVPAAVTDGNVVRVLARLCGEEKIFRDGVTAAEYFSPIAAGLLDENFPGEHNEAMMELGAILCSRRSPRCLFCPVRDFCAARARGIEESLPRFQPKTIKKVTLNRFWCRKGNAVLLVRNTTGTRRLKNLCEIPNAADFSFPSAEKFLAGKEIFVGKRGIADEQITERFFSVPAKNFDSLVKNFVGAHTEIFAAEIETLETLTLSGPHRKWLRELLKIPLDCRRKK